MFNRLLIIYGCLLILGGCINKEESMPRIVYTPQPEPKIVQPKVPKRIQPATKSATGDWLPPSHLEKQWTAIVIHHSATDNGDAAIFDSWHKEKNWEGVGYDFVIGNGTNSTDGQVEVTFRWRKQQTGAHCKTPDNWANESAVGICLVGNFNETTPTNRQMQSLLELTRFLQNRYGIPKSRIYGHKNTPGARATDCPGRNFPMAWLKSMLNP